MPKPVGREVEELLPLTTWVPRRVVEKFARLGLDASVFIIAIADGIGSPFQSELPLPNESTVTMQREIPPKDYTSNRDGKVYFVLAPGVRRIKIGFTSGDPLRRVASLQTGSAEELMLLGSFAGRMADEIALQQQFQQQRVVGEWFNPNDHLLDVIMRRCSNVNELALRRLGTAA